MPIEHYLGLMSGTSLDGVDGVLIAIDESKYSILSKASLPFPPPLRDELLALQYPCHNELHREALAANALAHLYANCVAEVLAHAPIATHQVRALGAHGQTIRHQPKQYDGIGYTRQTLAPALLAELTGIDVIADFRSRDVAAHGQGAPLVPAFHQDAFGSSQEARVICNIGGIANLSILPATGHSQADKIIGFDCGPGNILLDYWANKHLGTDYDNGGAWAASGTLHEVLLATLMQEDFLQQPPPKSTGRDLFNADWLTRRCQAVNLTTIAPQDVQTTLTYYTAQCITQAVMRHAQSAQTLIVCGGGVLNHFLMQLLKTMLSGWQVLLTDDFGIPAKDVEACAFAWLAWRFMHGLPGNLQNVTGARGPRILGALYPK
jgi:anhydro-N-acetylmuramic acid kinase